MRSLPRNFLLKAIRRAKLANVSGIFTVRKPPCLEVECIKYKPFFSSTGITSPVGPIIFELFFLNTISQPASQNTDWRQATRALSGSHPSSCDSYRSCTARHRPHPKSCKTLNAFANRTPSPWLSLPIVNFIHLCRVNSCMQQLKSVPKRCA